MEVSSAIVCLAQDEYVQTALAQILRGDLDTLNDHIVGGIMIFSTEALRMRTASTKLHVPFRGYCTTPTT